MLEHRPGEHLSDKELGWKFAEDFPLETEPLLAARLHSLEHGVEAVSPAVGSQLAVIAAASNARQIVEIGTGLGVSGLWLMKGAPRATLTSIDTESDYQTSARKSFAEAGILSSRVRLIHGSALDVLPRMNDESYDIVFVDGDPHAVIEYVEHGLRLARVGGTVLVARALWRGRVADPTSRDDTAQGIRALLREIAGSPAVVSAISPAGDGLLQLTRLN
jgi:predicted O-methyltransferase YrrM